MVLEKILKDFSNMNVYFNVKLRFPIVALPTLRGNDFNNLAPNATAEYFHISFSFPGQVGKHSKIFSCKTWIPYFGFEKRPKI